MALQFTLSRGSRSRVSSKRLRDGGVYSFSSGCCSNERVRGRKDPLGALLWRKTNESEDALYVWIWIRIQRMDVGSHALDHVAGNCSRGGLHLGACAMAQQESGAPATARRTSYRV